MEVMRMRRGQPRTVGSKTGTSTIKQNTEEKRPRPYSASTSTPSSLNSRRKRNEEEERATRQRTASSSAGENGDQKERQFVTEFIDEHGVTGAAIGDMLRAAGNVLGPRSEVDEERLKELALDKIRSTQEYAGEIQPINQHEEKQSRNEGARNDLKIEPVDDDGDVVMSVV